MDFLRLDVLFLAFAIVIVNQPSNVLACLERRDKIVRKPRNASGTERDHEIARLNIGQHLLDRGVDIADIRHVLVTKFLDIFCQDLGRNAFDRLFTRRVNVQYVQNIRVIERDHKIVHQFVRSRVSMGLKYDDRPLSARTVLGGGQCRDDLGRVMPVVINDRDTANLALELKDDPSLPRDLDAQVFGYLDLLEKTCADAQAKGAEVENIPPPVDGAGG